MTLALPRAEWLAEGEARYGPKLVSNARFVCPACGHEQSSRDWLDEGVPWERIHKLLGYHCVGVAMDDPRDAFADGPGPCDYTAGTLMKLHPITVIMEDGTTTPVFDFADEPLHGAPE